MTLKLKDRVAVFSLDATSIEALGRAYELWVNHCSKHGLNSAPVLSVSKSRLLEDPTIQFPRLLFPDSIRILELLPSKHLQDPLVGRLSLRRLHHHKCRYEALSYVWGSLNETMELLCNGKMLHITRNLADALRKLRYQDASRYLWIDAICINQKDTNERGHQVRLMRSIYEKSQRALIWIGDAPLDRASLAFSIIRRIISHIRVKYADLLPVRKDLSVEAALLHRQLEGRKMQKKAAPVVDSSWDVIEKLFSSRWFWRLWVIQEVVAAPSSVLIWGSVSIQWSLIGEAANWIKANYPPSRRTHIFGAYNASYIYQMAMEARRSRLHPFFTVVATTWLFESTDPRDRVFALLGLPNSDSHPEHGELFLEPDYSLTTSQVYLAFARRVLAAERSLRLFNAVQHTSDELLSKPSWAPQWQPRSMEPLVPMNHINNRLSASYCLSNQSLFTSDPELLILRGLTIDRVTGNTINSYTEQSLQERYIHSPDRCNLIKLLQDLLDAQSHQLTLNRLKSLCWTLTAGRGHDFWASQDNHWDNFQALWVEARRHFSTKSWELIGNSSSYSCDDDITIRETDHILVPAPITPSPCGIHQFLGSATYGRRLFVTSKGLIGLGPPTTREEDVVVILFGGFTPFILRRVENHYLLIGECYVHGHMDGAAIEEWEEEEHESEIFYLR